MLQQVWADKDTEDKHRIIVETDDIRKSEASNEKNSAHLYMGLPHHHLHLQVVQSDDLRGQLVYLTSKESQKTRSTKDEKHLKDEKQFQHVQQVLHRATLSKQLIMVVEEVGLVKANKDHSAFNPMPSYRVHTLDTQRYARGKTESAAARGRTGW